MSADDSVHVDHRSLAKPLRLWPGVIAAALLVLVRFGVPLVRPDWAVFGMLGAAVGALLILVWWLLFSRAPWLDRLAAIVLMVVALVVTKRIVDPSIANAGMGNLLYIFATPAMAVALVAWAVASRRLSPGARRVSLAAAIFLSCASFALVRTGGVTGDGKSDIHWRWTPTPEQRLLASAREHAAVSTPPVPARIAPAPKPAEPAEKGSAAEAANVPTPASAAPVTTKAPDKPHAARSEDEAASVPAVLPAPKREAEWPGFRGPYRDGVVRGVRIKTDWSQTPPVEQWRRPVGPGWSSFAVHGDVFYTQEQRGEEEIVAAYKVATGDPVWRHRDPVRFWESNGGAGPRATPTVHNGRVYTLGATGIVNALDEASGAVIWSRNAGTDTERQVPGWGFASSPLAIDDLVIVAASGRLIAYDIATGNQRWLGPDGGGGYSSPHFAVLDGVPQILLLRGARTTSVAPADGTLLWEHRAEPSVSIVQPAVTGGGNVLVATGDMMGGLGIRRLAVAHGSGGWTVEERWNSRGLKPYYNDFVVHQGYAFGFDGNILSCIDLKDGSRKWKGGRYGNGQLVLLAEQDVLLVLSEDGDIALVAATPDQFKEIAKIPSLEGKTWNHPVLVGDTLLVRNDHEMVAYRVPLEASGRKAPSHP